MITYDTLRARWQADKTRRQERARAMKQAVLTKGPAVFEKFGIQTVVLFGSVQDGRSHAASDIDLLAMPLAARDYWRCRHELEEALDYPLDLYTQDDDPIFVRKILDRGETIYDVQS